MPREVNLADSHARSVPLRIIPFLILEFLSAAEHEKS